MTTATRDDLLLPNGNPRPDHAADYAALYDGCRERNADGEWQGRDPRKMEAGELEAAGHVKRSLLSVIRDNCIECCGGGVAEVRRCSLVHCVFWPYRMTSNPFNTRDLSDDQKAANIERLRKAREARV